jgi:flagellum-specific ATP synthase
MPATGFCRRLRPFIARGARLPTPPVEGRLTRLVGLALEARGCHAAVGDRCTLLTRNGTRTEAEVVGFSGDRLLLMPTGRAEGLEPDTRVIPARRAGTVAVGVARTDHRRLWDAARWARSDRMRGPAAPERR